RDFHVTGVQTCALPICLRVEPQPWAIWPALGLGFLALTSFMDGSGWVFPLLLIAAGAYLLFRQDGFFGISVKVQRSGPGEPVPRSEERRVGAGWASGRA